MQGSLRTRFFALSALLGLFLAGPARAEETFRAQARLFFGMAFAKPDQANALMEAQGLETFSSLARVGAEVTYPVLGRLDVGIRYARVFNTRFEADGGQTHSGTITQDAMLLLARFPILRTDIFKLDVFGGIGGTNSTFEIKTGSLDGKYSKSATKDWVASPYAAAGASAGVGYGGFFLYVEAGFDRNRVSKLERSGNVPGGVDSLGLTGPYALVGLLFDGITVSKR